MTRDIGSIIDASELHAAGERGAAEASLMKMLAQDLRCLDAHAHLGTDFDGVLPWGHVGNRPYLRCLHGVGLCFWRLGALEEAAKTFTRMLWINPSDNQGERFKLANVQAGRTWEQCEEDEA
jgi:hypothetical protein